MTVSSVSENILKAWRYYRFYEEQLSIYISTTLKAFIPLDPVIPLVEIYLKK